MSKSSQKPTFGSLFAGIGGFDLGLERAGWEPKWQVEIDPFCRKVLEKHWPDVRRFEDVKEVGKAELEKVDLICGGFPCPIVSSAARGRNVGEWLWPEFSRIIRLLRPKFVLVENVDGLRRRRFGEILGSLAEIGYDAEWIVLPAKLFGAPHKRSRIWLVAYPNNESESINTFHDEAPSLREFEAPFSVWKPPTEDLRMDDGLPHRMDRIRALGNAVVPQIVEWLGERLLDRWEEE